VVRYLRKTFSFFLNKKMAQIDASATTLNNNMTAANKKIKTQDKTAGTENDSEYQQTLRQIEHTLSKLCYCYRCGVPFRQLKALGRLQCLYHPRRATDCTCERLLLQYNEHAAGCTSVDHCVSDADARTLYALFPASVWNDLAPLNDNHTAKAVYKRGNVQRPDLHRYLIDDLQVVAVTSVEQAYGKSLRVFLYGEKEPHVISLHEAYDECAHLYHYAPLEQVSRVAAANDERMLRQDKLVADLRPIGDAPEHYATAQRLLFDLDVLERVSLETPDFVPYVIVFRVELFNIEQF
jgi:hypothetical protein